MQRLGALAAVCAAVFASTPAAAQVPAAGPAGGASGTGSGALRGVVTDQASDSGVAGAHVLLVGTPLTTRTDEGGRFVFVGLAPGPYTVRVVSIGFVPAVTGIVVAADSTVELDVALTRAALQLAGITVTATGSAQKVGESAVSVSVVERDEILAHNTIQVQDVLPFIPGVVMDHGQLDIRGASGLAGGVGSRVLMLLDGHPVLTGDGGEIDYETLPLLDLDRAEVVKGSHSALYGSAAMGGVVNLISTPIDERPESMVKLHWGAYDVPSEFRFTTGRLDWSGYDLQHSRRVGPVGVRFAVGRETSDGYEQNGEFSRWFLRAKLGSLPGASHPWDAYAIWSSLASGQFFVWDSAGAPYTVPTVALGDWNRVINVLAGGRYAAVAGSRALLEIEPSLTHTLVRDHMHDSKNWHQATRAGVNVRLSLNPGSQHAVTAGVDVAGTGVNASYYGKKGLVDAAPYAQEELAVTPQLKATAGVRLDYHHLDGAASETAFNPKVGLAWTPAAGGPLSLRASFGRGYRAPSVIEQFVSTTQGGFRVVPNPSLHGETAWSGEVGGTADLGRVWLDGALFAGWYDGLIGPAPVAGQFGAFSFQNVQRARVSGVDATSKLSVVRHWVDLSLSYLFLDARDLDANAPLPYRSRHTVTGSLDLLGGAAGVDVRYRSRLDTTVAYPLDPRTAVTIVDLRAAARVSKVTLLLKVANLLQEKYVDIMERNQGAPRSLLITGMASF